MLNRENVPVRVLSKVPEWIDQDIDLATVDAIAHGGCASGAYMPAVTYHQARETMNEHGDDVLAYLEDTLGELPTVPKGESWSGMACHFLAYAVDLWAGGVSVIWEDLEETTYEELKDILRMDDIVYDPWGTAMGYFFRVCHVLHATRFEPIPESWGFLPGAGAAALTEMDYPLMYNLVLASDDTLLQFGEMLHRYMGMLRTAGRSY